MKRRLLSLTLILALALTACTAPAAQSSAQPSADPSAQPSAAAEVDTSKSLSEHALGLSADEVVMTVNGAPVTAARYAYWLGYNCNYVQAIYQTYYGRAFDFSDPAMAEALRGDAHNVITSFEVSRQLYEEYDITLTPEQEAEVRAALEQYPEEERAALLKAHGITEADYLEIQSDVFLYDNLIAAAVSQPTDEDIAQYIADHNVFGVKHILLKTVSADVTDEAGNVTQTAEEYNAGRKALAEELLSRLEQADDMPALFDTLMEEHSEDGRDGEGKLAAPDGYTFSDADSLVGGFREATLALEVGQLSGIVETDYGYHLLLRLPVERSAVEADCYSALTTAFLTPRMEGAEVEVLDGVAGLDVAAFFKAFTDYQAAVYQ